MPTHPLHRAGRLAVAAGPIVAVAAVIALLPVRVRAVPTYTATIQYPNQAIATLSQTNSTGIDLSDSKDNTLGEISAGFYTAARAFAGPGGSAGGSSDGNSHATRAARVRTRLPSMPGSSPTFSVNVGQPFGVLLELFTSASVVGDAGSCGEAKAKVLDPWSSRDRDRSAICRPATR
jgi:hypothetical protein